MPNKDYSYYLKMWNIYVDYTYNSNDFSTSPKNGLESVLGFITTNRYDDNLSDNLINELTDQEFINRFLSPNNVSAKPINTNNWFIENNDSYTLNMQECIESITQWQMMHDDLKDPQPLAISLDLIAVALDHNTRINRKAFLYWKCKLNSKLHNSETIRSFDNYSPKSTNKATVATEKRLDAIKESMLEFLESRLSKGQINISTLQKQLVPTLKAKGWIFEERGIDAHESVAKDKRHLAISTLRDDLYAVLKTDWWEGQNDHIRKQVSYKPSKKK